MILRLCWSQDHRQPGLAPFSTESLLGWNTAVFFTETLGKNPLPGSIRLLTEFSLLFMSLVSPGDHNQLLEAIHIPWFLAPSHAGGRRPHPACLHLSNCKLRKFSAFKCPDDSVGSTWIIQNNLLILRSIILISFAKSLLLCNLTYSQFLGIWM